jgi:hypothetical protein
MSKRELDLPESFTVKVPLRVNARQDNVLRQRCQVAGKLQNNLRGVWRKAGLAMKNDPEWKQAGTIKDEQERQAAFRILRERYDLDLSNLDAGNFGFARWKASGWMKDAISGQVALACGITIWTETQNWLYGHTELPRMVPSHECLSVRTTTTREGIMLDPEVMSVRWPQARRRARKDLDLPLKWSNDERDRRLNGGKITSCGLAFEGGYWFALIKVQGVPYRNPEYVEAARPVKNRTIGIDPGVSSISVVGTQGSAKIELCEQDKLDARRHDAVIERRLKRALNRSQRATNPEAFDLKGQHIKGKQLTKSKRYVRLQKKLARERRKARIHRDQDAVMIARQVLKMGGKIAVEDNDYRAWQAGRYGKRMALTRPGKVHDAIQREANVLHGRQLRELPSSLAMSQYCLCGSKVKKPLSRRVHDCKACGLGPLDRDLFSAFLVRLVAFTSAATSIDLSTGPFNRADIKDAARRSCKVGVAPMETASADSYKPGLSQAATTLVQTPRRTPVATGTSRKANQLSTSPELPAPDF